MLIGGVSGRKEGGVWFSKDYVAMQMRNPSEDLTNEKETAGSE